MVREPPDAGRHLARGASLLASRRPLDRVFVVDNDEADALARARRPRGATTVTYLHTGANLGFAGGVNAGVRAALADGADAVLLVNSDAVLAPSCLGHLEAARSSGAGRRPAIVAPLLLARAPTRRPSRRPASTTTAAPGRMRERARRPPARQRSMRRPGPRVAASGCVLLVTRAVWERAGLLDERYFFGFEDIDLCLRARAAGLRTRFEPRARGLSRRRRLAGPGLAAPLLLRGAQPPAAGARPPRRRPAGARWRARLWWWR